MQFLPITGMHSWDSDTFNILIVTNLDNVLLFFVAPPTISSSAHCMNSVAKPLQPPFSSDLTSGAWMNNCKKIECANHRSNVYACVNVVAFKWRTFRLLDPSCLTGIARNHASQKSRLFKRVWLIFIKLRFLRMFLYSSYILPVSGCFLCFPVLKNFGREIGADTGQNKSLTHGLRSTAERLGWLNCHQGRSTLNTVLSYSHLNKFVYDVIYTFLSFPVFEGELGDVLGHLGSVGSRQGFSWYPLLIPA